MDIDDRDYDVRVANQKSVFLFILGTILLLAAIAIESKVSEFVEEFLYIAGWVAIWEMCENLLLNNAQKRTERLNKLQLYDSEVTFVFDR